MISDQLEECRDLLVAASPFVFRFALKNLFEELYVLIIEFEKNSYHYQDHNKDEGQHQSPSDNAAPAVWTPRSRSTDSVSTIRAILLLLTFQSYLPVIHDQKKIIVKTS